MEKSLLKRLETKRTIKCSMNEHLISVLRSENPEQRLERIVFIRVLMKIMYDMGMSSYDAYLAGSEALNAHLLCSYRDVASS